MYTLLKLLKPFLLPPTLITLGMAICLFLFLCRKQRLGKVFLIVVLGVYYILSTEPVAYLLAKGLWCRGVVNISELQTEKVEAIVVLSGGAAKKGGCRPYNELHGASWRRFWHGIELYRQFKGRIPILYCGGTGDPFDPVPVETELVKSYAVTIGVPKEMFWTESASRNTYESGVEIKRILDERFPWVERHKIILVTSACHIPRSIKVMGKAGLDTIPSPADFIVGSFSLDPLSFIPSASSFCLSNFAIHEWIGIVSYKLLGRI